MSTTKVDTTLSALSALSALADIPACVLTNEQITNILNALVIAAELAAVQAAQAAKNKRALGRQTAAEMREMLV